MTGSERGTDGPTDRTTDRATVRTTVRTTDRTTDDATRPASERTDAPSDPDPCHPDPDPSDPDPSDPDPADPDPADPDPSDADPWSAVADGWAELWGTFPAPAWDVVVTTCAIGTGTRVLDVGCGGGDLLAHVARLGAVPLGADPAPGMVRVARSRVPAADVRVAPAHALPWPDASVDVVTAVNVVALLDDADDAVREMARVLVPGGRLALVGWAERDRNDLDAVQTAVALAADDDPPADDDLRVAGGLERLLRGAGLRVTASGTVTAPWTAPDDDALVRGVLLGEDDAGLTASAGTVLAAARPFRDPAGGYRLVSTLRYAVARA